MVITYRRTGGGLLLLLTVAAALAATVFTLAVGAALLIVGAAIGSLALLVRAMLPASWRRRPPAPATWPQETIEATVVNPRAASECDLVRMDSYHNKMPIVDRRVLFFTREECPTCVPLQNRLSSRVPGSDVRGKSRLIS